MPVVASPGGGDNGGGGYNPSWDCSSECPSPVLSPMDRLGEIYTNPLYQSHEIDSEYRETDSENEKEIWIDNMMESYEKVKYSDYHYEDKVLGFGMPKNGGPTMIVRKHQSENKFYHGYDFKNNRMDQNLDVKSLRKLPRKEQQFFLHNGAITEDASFKFLTLVCNSILCSGRKVKNLSIFPFFTI